MCFDILVLDTRYWILDGYQMLTRGYLYLGYLQVGHPNRGILKYWYWYWILDGYQNQILTRGYLYLGYLQVGHPIKGMSRRWIALLWVTDKQPIDRPWKLERVQDFSQK